MSEGVDYVFDGQPETGDMREVAPGVHWLRMPLPFKLDHINLWLVEDGDGWTAVDTGIARDEVKEAWEQIFASRLGGRPIKRVIVTHFHPDHMGLAGWLCERFALRLWATMGEWAFGRMLSLDSGALYRQAVYRFYQGAGFDDQLLEMVAGRGNPYAARVSPIPVSYRRLQGGETIDIGGGDWRVIVGTGHSPEHAGLFSEQLGVLISGDQILPRISPNVSVWPQEPEADPLALFLGSLDAFRSLPGETLVLPSHDWPFTGLHGRLDELAHHHDGRLAETLDICAQPRTGSDVLKGLFDRELDQHQVFFAIGESLAHLHYLEGQGRIERRRRDDGVILFSRV